MRHSCSNPLRIPCVLWLPRGSSVVLGLSSGDWRSLLSAEEYGISQTLRIRAFGPRQKPNRHALTAGKSQQGAAVKPARRILL